MRPIGALDAGPLRFPGVVVASPGQRPMQSRQAGYDLTARPSARGRFTARPRLELAARRQGAAAERKALALALLRLGLPARS
jgi:hypothetical protein